MSVGDRGRAAGEENVMFYRTVVGISTLLGVTAITFSIREKSRMGCHQMGGRGGEFMSCVLSKCDLLFPHLPLMNESAANKFRLAAT